MTKKFRIYFNNGTSMLDRNRSKSISEVKEWAKGHNKSLETKRNQSYRVIKVTEVKKAIRRKQVNPMRAFGVPSINQLMRM